MEAFCVVMFRMSYVIDVMMAAGFGVYIMLFGEQLLKDPAFAIVRMMMLIIIGICLILCLMMWLLWEQWPMNMCWMILSMCIKSMVAGFALYANMSIWVDQFSSE